MKRARPKNKSRMQQNRQHRTEREQRAGVYGEYDDAVSAIRKKSEDNISNASERTSAPHTERKKTKKKGRPLKIVLVTVMILAVVIFVAMGFGLFDDAQILSPLEDGRVNVLILGVDEEGLRTDAIMAASYDVNAAQVHMISIPRDTKVYVENRKMTRKINEIHAMSSKKKSGEIAGAEATAEAVSQLIGMPINYYVEFSFSAIDKLFDSLGPVEFDVPDVEGGGAGMNYDDPVQNLHIHLKPGLQKLSGNQVQQFLRYRKSNSHKSSGSDTDRVARQQEFVKAVIDQKVNPALLIKLPTIFAQLSKEIKTNITAGEVTKYIRYINKLTGESIHTYSLPGEAKMISRVSYFVCNLDETLNMMREIFGEDFDENTKLTDKITISDNHSQKILKGGNLTKSSSKSKGTDTQSTKAPSKTAESTKAPQKESTKSPEKTASPAPTKAPAVTKSPTKAPEVTKEPLEDMDEDYIYID